jgi:Tol biopolymer transport system component
MAGGRLLVAALAGMALVLPGARAAGESAARRVVGGTGSGAMPAWTADGRALLFHSRRKDERQRGIATRNIWSIGADGTGERRLTKGNKDEYHAALSPDGRKLLYVSEVNGSRDVWIADADGQNAVPLTDDPGTEDQPAWAPDGRQIAYAAFPKEGGSFDLWLVNADGSGRRRLTATPANEIFPAWHPNGEDIVYVTDASGNFDLYAINVRDGRTRPLVTSPDHEARPAWSPDGTKLAFSRWPARGRSTDATLWVANADGSGAIELRDAPAPATHPAWAPDGHSLAFQHRGEAGWEIWTLALPVEVAGWRRLRAGQQPPAGADADTVRLQGGETLRGRLQETQLRVRTAYGAVDLSRAAVASVLFDTGERALARVVLANGDTLTGLLEAAAVHLATGGRTQALAVERIAQLSLRPGRGAAEGSFRAVMRNGDSLRVTESFGPLRLHVGERPTDVEAQRIDRVEFAEDGKKASVVLRNGDSLSGELASERLELGLAVGARLTVHPSAIRTLVRAAAPAPAARTGG